MSKKNTTEKREHFERLIKKVESQFQASPESYKRKLGLLAILGYVYLFAVLLTLLGSIAIMGWIALNNQIAFIVLFKKFGIFILIILFGIFKALWVRIDPPQGYSITRQVCPKLFDEIDYIRERIDAPPLHQVILTEDYNAFINQTPRLGVFGWNKNTLGLGLPLLLDLSPEGLRMVLAHEFGHLSRQHARFSGWIYRIRTSWLKIMDAFDASGKWSEWFFGKFFDWYAPYFNAYSFAFARANEFQADAIAAELTSPQTVVQTLVQVDCQTELIARFFWTRINKEAEISPNVKADAFSELKSFIEDNPYPEEELKETIDRLLSKKTDYSDTHPSLSDRIRPYGNKFKSDFTSSTRSAEKFLGKQLQIIIKDFDSRWAEECGINWKERYEYTKKAKEELSKLESKRDEGKLSKDEAWNLAHWTEEFKEDADPLPLYQSYFEKFPNDPVAMFTIGRILVDRGEEQGIHYLEKAGEKDYQLMGPSCELAHDFYLGKADENQANHFLLKSEKHMDLLIQSNAERSEVHHKDIFIPHDLSQEQKFCIRELFNHWPKIKKLWICQKRLETLSEEPLYILVYKTRMFSFINEDEINHSIVDNLDTLNSFIVIWENSDPKVARKVKKAGEQIL